MDCRQQAAAAKCAHVPRRLLRRCVSAQRKKLSAVRRSSVDQLRVLEKAYAARSSIRAQANNIPTLAVDSDADFQEDYEEDQQVSTSGMRPWTFSIPSMHEVATNENWYLKVEDWKAFWAMFNNWIWVYQTLVYMEENKLAADEEFLEAMEWLQIEADIVEGKVGKLIAVIDAVIGSIRGLKTLGYPVPTEIAGKFPGFTGSRSRTYKVDDWGSKYIEYGEIEGNAAQWDVTPDAEEEMDGSGYSDISRPWDDWDEWEHRVYLEKQRMHRQKQAKFAKKQAELGKWRHLVVSPSTDSRWAEDSYFYPINERDYTHEEIMATVRLNGQATDPLQIPINVVDPDSYADGFREGVHFVPDTIDYVREIGHLVEREEELIGERETNLPSATLDEEFADGGESPLDDINTEIDDEGALDGFTDVTSEEMGDDE